MLTDTILVPSLRLALPNQQDLPRIEGSKNVRRDRIAALLAVNLLRAVSILVSTLQRVHGLCNV